MYTITGEKNRKSRLLVKCISVLLTVAVCLVNTPLSFAFTSSAKATFSASVTIGGADSDYDGIPNSWEQVYGLDPNDPDDAYDDQDNDGINNLEEYRKGADPTVSDSGIVAILTATPSSGQQPLDIQFSAGSSGGTYPIVKYEWDFDGNGTYDQWSYASEGNTAVYKYTADGTYNARLRVTDSMGNCGIATATVNITRNEALLPPTATPELSFVNISIPQTRQLNGAASDDEGITRYQWDTTGNGEYDISLDGSADVTKTYNETITRSFNAALKVTDTDGLSDIATVGVTTDATAWNSSPNRPKVFPNRFIVYGTAGIPVLLGGYGMPQMGNDYGYAKKLEWDFEGDGIYDWSSTVDNDDWNGRADLTHTYGAAGIYRAVLKAHTEANLSSTDSVLVIISAAGTPPTAEATVTYNGTVDASDIEDTIPIKAQFDHSQSTGTIAKYEWDFDGDKRIDYSTTSFLDVPSYDYRYPGYYVASLKVTDTNGLIDTSYIPVFAYYPATYSSYIKEPAGGLTVAGNALTVTCEVFPDDAGVSSVMLQYRKEGDSLWSDIGLGVSVMSYMASWDTTGLENGASYQLRAIVNGVASALFKTTSVVVDNLTSSPDIYETKNGTHTKRVKVDPNKSNLIVLPDGTQIYVPYGAMEENGSLPEVTVEEVIGPSAGVGNSIDINITGIDKFLKDITISIPYPDVDNDGIVDGTGIDENTLVVKWYNPDTNAWEPLYNSVVYPEENYVSAEVNHLSLFGLGPAIVASGAGAAVGGGSAAVGATETISYCFIATAAYGTPMTKEVVALKVFRDTHLMRNDLGRKFVFSYYRYSPPIAEYISKKPALRAIVRFLLKPLVNIAKALTYRV